MALGALDWKAKMRKVLHLPWPPSVNNAWRNHNGRVLVSKTMREWRKKAEHHLTFQKTKPVPGEVTIIVHLYPPTRRKYDIDNKLKSILDLLVHAHIIEDDNCDIVRQITVKHMAVCNDNPGVQVYIQPNYE